MEVPRKLCGTYPVGTTRMIDTSMSVSFALRNWPCAIYSSPMSYLPIYRGANAGRCGDTRISFVSFVIWFQDRPLDFFRNVKKIVTPFSVKVLSNHINYNSIHFGCFSIFLQNFGFFLFVSLINIWRFK